MSQPTTLPEGTAKLPEPVTIPAADQLPDWAKLNSLARPPDTEIKTPICRKKLTGSAAKLLPETLRSHETGIVSAAMVPIPTPLPLFPKSRKPPDVVKPDPAICIQVTSPTEPPTPAAP